MEKVREVGRTKEVMTIEETRRRRALAMKKYRRRLAREKKAKYDYKEFLSDYFRKTIQAIPDDEVSFFSIYELLTPFYEEYKDRKEEIINISKQHFKDQVRS